MEVVEFCTKYHLSDEIYQLLEKDGYDTTHALFEANEFDLKEANLKLGHIAEVKWALNKIQWEKFGKIATAQSEGENKPDVTGGIGGGGGDAPKGGMGGTGERPRFSDRTQANYFADISGGAGGAGGAGIIKGLAGTSEDTKFKKEAPIRDATGNSNGHRLSGGAGGAGGWGARVGGSGGLGEAAQLEIEYVGIFTSIGGGSGGSGGESKDQGGTGGTGQGSAFPKLLLTITDETRGGIPFTSLEDFPINGELRESLQNYGFRTVGGLFEVYDADLWASGFKTGYIRELTAALRKFVARLNVGNGTARVSS